MLVPLGVDPEQIAALRFNGSWSGPESDRYCSIAEDFQQLLEAPSSEAVRLVAEAGVRMFTAAQESAAVEERQQRVRGER